MIRKFDDTTALLLIDVQKGVNDTQYYGGKTGRRNNPDAEANIAALLTEWRRAGGRVAFTRHDSREAGSPLKLSLESGSQLDGLEPAQGDIVVTKDVNSGFIGTPLEVELRRAGIQRLVVAGFFTNFCVETTVRMAGNMGFDTYLVHDACATMNRVGLDGTDYDPDLVHGMSVASLHGEFCTALSTRDAIGLCTSDASHLARAQGNE
ncbi:MAG: cysteine hydrolase family protein [Arenicellales bacterium]|nr:cysteine hydrolase family protein [Arenicellales bacterium]